MLGRPALPVFTDPRHQFGHDIEVRVGRWLTRRGWRVLAHRFQLGRHDIDLIVRQGRLVAFVEVKARRDGRCGAAVESVGLRKRAIIERLAWSWLVRFGAVGDQYRFDVAGVQGAAGRERVRLVEDAWRPGWSR